MLVLLWEFVSVFVLEYLKEKIHNLMNITIHYQLVQNNFDVINLE